MDSFVVSDLPAIIENQLFEFYQQAETQPQKIAILTGLTASGKTQISLNLAQQIPGLEIINADSLLVYRGMDIGTAKPTPEELAQVPHHLVDIRNPDESFTAGDFLREAQSRLAEIEGRRGKALVVGGTGFYLQALLYGMWKGPGTSTQFRQEQEGVENETLYSRLTELDPESAIRIGKADRYRLIRALEIHALSGGTPSALRAEMILNKPDPRMKLFLLIPPASVLEERVQKRVQHMLDLGWEDEVRKLMQAYPGARPLDSVGYRQMVAYLHGVVPEGRRVRMGLDGLKDEVVLATRQLLKKQRTAFKNLMQRVSGR